MPKAFRKAAVRARPSHDSGCQCLSASRCTVHTTVQPCQTDCAFGCGRVFHKGGSIFVTVGFHISGPAFHITGRSDKVSDVRGIASGEGNCLIQVSGKSFVGKSAEEFQTGSAAGIINVNHIWLLGVNRWCEVKGRTEETFHGWMDRPDLVGHIA